MSNCLDQKIDLSQVQIKQDTTVCALRTLAFLLDISATDFESNKKFAPEEFAYGLSGLLTLISSDLDAIGNDISSLHDQLRLNGGRK